MTNKAPMTNAPPMRRRGIIEIEILIGLIILGALVLALGAVLGRQHRAAQKLADTRAAAQVAETVLTDLQAGRDDRRFAGDPDVAVQLRPADEKPAGEAPRDKWVEVVVTVRGGRAALVGLVPGGAK
jgi:type II secretory pathway pseudopilin PulG